MTPDNTLSGEPIVITEKHVKVMDFAAYPEKGKLLSYSGKESVSLLREIHANIEAQSDGSVRLVRTEELEELRYTLDEAGDGSDDVDALFDRALKIVRRWLSLGEKP